jgi:AcrR family transcriptional regulator
VTEGLSTRQRAKREQITAAARRLFLGQGFAGTSMDAVTAEAGVSKQTLYSYFPTKIELLADVLYGSVSKLVLSPPPPDRLRSLDDLRAALLAFATVLTHNMMRPQTIALVRLVLGEAFRVAELRRAFRQALPGQILSRTEALLQQGADAGLITFPDPDLAARMFVGPLMTYIALDGFLSAEPAEPPSAEALEHLVDAFLTSVAVRS